MFSSNRLILIIAVLCASFQSAEFCSAASSMSSLFRASNGSRDSSISKGATRIHITQGHVKPDPVAFVSLYGESDYEKDIGDAFIEIVKNNLCGCGSFCSVSKDTFLQSAQVLAKSEPRMQDWRLIKARFLVCGTVQPCSGGHKINIRVYDVNCGLRLLVFSVVVQKHTFRKAAHMASDQIYTRLTGECGMFNTQLVYIETMPEQTRKGKKITHLRRLKIMDQDGASDTPITDGNDLVMSPRFSPDGKTIAYLSYRTEGSGKNKKRKAHVYLFDVVTRRQRPLLTPEHFRAISKANGGAQVNMTYAPRFSPDGRSICFSLVINGKSAIYSMNIVEGKIRRLTSHISIDTSPAYSKNGRQIIFTSDRSGKEKIYLMDADGSNVRRVTNGEGKYSQPIFSPRGDFLAFSKQVGNQFFIGVVRPNGTEERLIVQSYLAESPCWSANGRYIIFTKQASPGAKRKLCIVDLTGYFMKDINSKREAYDCSWSPLLNN
jgi:TolB protein